MRELPRAAAVYILAVVAVGTAVLAHAAGRLHLGGGTFVDYALLTFLAVLADLKVVALSYKVAYSVATAVNFAGVIVFGPYVGTCVSAVSSAAGDIWNRRPLHKVAFNSCLAGLSVAAGGAAFEATRTNSLGALSPSDLPAFGAYAAVNLLVNQTLLCTVVGLVTGSRPFDVAAANYRGLIVPVLALFPLGVLMAVTYVYFGKWLGTVLLVVPTVTVHDALNRAQQLREQTRATLEALADAIDQRDRYTAEHSRRVANYAERIAVTLGLSIAQREALVSAARVHDLGKLSTPDEVLRKTDSLTQREWQIMRSHPIAGSEILAKLPMYRQAARIVRHHHERMDGSGYPDGLTEVQMPLGARVLAVADAFDAMTSNRHYRNALSPTIALARLRDGIGTQFSVEAVEALARVLELDADAPPEGAQAPSSPGVAKPAETPEGAQAPSSPGVAKPAETPEGAQAPERMPAQPGGG